MRRRLAAAGFTLMELVIVIILLAILGVVIANIIQAPAKAVTVVQQRAQLADILATAMHRITTEARLALSYSVRTSGTNAVEFLRIVDGGRYRSQGANRLKFNQNSDTFDVFNTLRNPAAIQTGSASTDCISGLAWCLVVYNIGQPLTVATATVSGTSANAYLGASTAFDGNIATISAAAAHSLSFDNSDLTPSPWHFGIASAGQRFYVVDTAVSFVCAGDEVNRYEGYGINENFTVPPAGGSGPQLLADNVTSCSFTHSAPTITRFGILTVRLGITNPVSGEQAGLIQQVHFSNLP